MPSTNLGKVSVTPKGEWSASAAYEILDIVAKDGSSYLALTSVPSGTALSNTSYWLLIAEKGDKGDTGEISGASASISGGYGTPSVTVTEGGTSTDRSFAFAFSNLVGDGIASISVEKTDTSGAVDTYTMTITMDSGDTDTVTWTVTNGSVTSVNGRTGAVTGLAEEDGYYEEMSVGSADQLISSVYVEDSVPYNFRTSGGSADIGDRDFEDAVVGGSIAWNQLQINTHNRTYKGVTFTYSNGVLTVSGTTEGVSWWCDANSLKFDILADHVYLFSAGNSDYSYVDSSSAFRWYLPSVTPSTIYVPNKIIKPTVGANTYLQLQINDVGQLTTTTFIPQLFDLTQMFGSTIADYIYGLEQNNSGSGVAWFKALFPKPYYAYNSGTLIHVNASAHETTGFNQWDEEWEVGAINATTGATQDSTNTIRSKNFCGMLPDISYCIRHTANIQIGVYMYDANYNYLGRTTLGSNTTKTFTSLSGTRYFKIMYGNSTNPQTTYNNDICINLHWDGERDGEYEEYVKHSYALDSDLTLRGIPKLDANNKLYWDGDRYANDGTVERDWIYKNDFSRGALDTTGKIYKIGTISDVGTSGSISDKGLSNLYPLVTLTECRNNSDNGVKSLTVYSTSVYISGFIGDTSGLDAILPSLELVYRPLVPTTESADAFTSPQIIDDFGTEWFTVTEQSGVAMPVGHESRYTNNLRAKLEMSPESPATAGDYIVRQENGENTYVPLVIPSELPTAPSSDGNYLLKCVVADGTATYSWVAQT